MSDWLSVLNSSTKHIEACANNLDRLGRAFLITGNEFVAEDLFVLSETLSIVANDIAQARSNAVTEIARAADQASANMIRAALAVANREIVK